MSGFVPVVGRELRLVLRQPGEAATALAFFVLATALFPLGVGPDAGVLGRIAAGVVWVVALLAALLPLERMFRSDHDDGSLELLALMPAPLELLVLAKAAAHWLTTALPLIAVAPVLGAMLNLPGPGPATLCGVLALGTATVSLVGAVGAALTLGARRGGVLLPLLVLPLLVPVLIFGAGAVDAAISGFALRQHVLLLGGLSLAAAALCPWAAAAALRQAME